MNTPILLASFGNLFGPDMMVIFGLEIAVVVGLVLLVAFLVRRGNSSGTKNSLEDRLRRLDALHRSGSISDDEREEQRRRILADT